MAFPRVTLRQLQIFAAVARSGSTVAASEAIALSQSATSAALQELERLLGVPVFDRAGRRLLLNDHGRALLPRAAALLDSADGIERLSQDLTVQAQVLRIGASTTIGNHLLPKLLARFLRVCEAERAPLWHSVVTIANTAAVCNAVANFQLDVGLIEGINHEPGLDVRPWVGDELVIVASPKIRLAQRYGGRRGKHRAPIDELRDATWLLREAGSGTREVADHALLTQLGHYRRSIEIGSSEAIKRAVMQGAGIAALSHWVVTEELAAGQLCVLRTRMPRMPRSFSLVLSQAKQLTPALQVFLDTASQVAAQPPARNRR